MQPELAALLDGIGPRVRRVRQGRGLTLDQLADRTGLSVSTLSRLESGKRRPSLELLIPVARTLRVALDDIVAAPLTGDPRVHLQPIRRQAGDVVVPLTKYPGRVQVYKQILGPRDPELVTHGGSAWLYVLSGQLRLILGESEQILGPGETAEFDTAEPHWFGPADERVCELLHLTRHELPRPGTPGRQTARTDLLLRQLCSPATTGLPDHRSGSQPTQEGTLMSSMIAGLIATDNARAQSVSALPHAPTVHESNATRRPGATDHRRPRRGWGARRVMVRTLRRA